MDKDNFLNIIANTPLVSIDIILRDESNRILLGHRNNRPAKDFWFVPGGRIRKNETLEQAMTRISTTELGFEVDINAARLVGAYNHIYEDNFNNTPNVNTHYVALGYEITQTDSMPKVVTDNQHSEFKWMAIRELLQTTSVHENTKAYFNRSI